MESLGTSNIDYNDIIVSLIENNLEKMLKKAHTTVQTQIRKILIDLNVSFKAYLNNSYNKYSTIKTLIYKTEPKNLYDFFVPNNLSINNNCIDIENVNTILDISHFMIIEGLGGMGKTILLKHCFIDSLKNTDLIPIFIELKDLNNYTGSLIDYIYYNLQKLGFKLEKKYLEYGLETGSFLLLFDGYDEVSVKKSDTLFREIDDLCDRYSDNYFILSSRPCQTFIEFQRFSVAKVLEFSKSKAIDLIKKLDFDIEIKSRFLDALDNTLYDTHESFASNPLLLTIMLLTFENYAEIPEKLHIFYANAFDTLYIKHDATKAGYKREMRCKLAQDDFKKIFSEFCFKTYVKDKYSFYSNDIVEQIKSISKQTCAFEVEDFLWDLTNSICVIFLDGLSYSFTHRSFQEYFAAYYIKECSDSKMQKICSALIEQNNLRTMHDSVFRMLYDMCPDRFEKNVVFPIFEKHEACIDNSRNRIDQFCLWLCERITITLIKKDSELDKKDDSDSAPESYGIRLALTIQNSIHHLVIISLRRNLCLDKAEVTQNEYQNKFIKYLLQSKAKNGNSNRFDFNSTQIFENEIIYDFIIKASWIGQYARIASTLYKTLLEKQHQEDIELESLLK